MRNFARLFYLKFIEFKCWYYKINKQRKIKIIKSQYKKKIGHKLDILNPIRYTEKIQNLKLHNKQLELMTKLSDKIEVRSFIDETIGASYLIPVLGIFDSFDQIDFDNLPNQFIIKTNHGSGTNILVKDKTQLDYTRTRQLLNHWLKINYAYLGGYEMQYENIKPRILIEELISTEKEIQDYKFLCFNGVPEYFWIDFDRFSNHKRNLYSLEWILQSWNQRDYGNYTSDFSRPDNFNEMVEISKKLAKGFAHVRIDLYTVNKKIYFGEMTFTNGSGFERIVPDEYDLYLGRLWKDEINNGN